MHGIKLDETDRQMNRGRFTFQIKRSETIVRVGRFLAPAGRRYAPLVVNQTTARSLPSQQTRENGQMIESKLIPL